MLMKFPIIHRHVVYVAAVVLHTLFCFSPPTNADHELGAEGRYANKKIPKTSSERLYYYDVGRSWNR